MAHSTLADANRERDWRIYADLAQGLIARARKLYAQESLGIELEQTVYALDSTTIDLCLSRSLGRAFAPPRPLSNSTRCWISVGPSPR